MDRSTVFHTRECFYVGGHYHTKELNKKPDSGYIMTKQIYVEELRPVAVTKAYPIIFWHGACSTGACWVTTPDGRPGWASYFLRQGYVVYLVDAPERGRSAANAKTGDMLNVDNEYVEKYWTATANNKGLWPRAEFHTQWPGTGKLGDPVFDNFMASEVQTGSDYLAAELAAKNAGTQLLEKTGPAIICTHSQGGSHGWLIADAAPSLVKGIVALEPVGPPFVNQITSVVSRVDPHKHKRPYGLTIAPMAYSPSINSADELQTRKVRSADPQKCDLILQTDPPRKLIHLSTTPILVVTSESGYHSYYDYATVSYLRQAGVEVEHLDLTDAGIRGNGHFMFLEENNVEIADLVQRWLTRFEKP